MYRRDKIRNVDRGWRLWGLWALGSGLGLELGWDLVGFETEIGLLENGEVVSCAVGLAGRDLVGLKRKLVLLENGEVVSRPEKKVSRWPTSNKQFLFISFLRV